MPNRFSIPIGWYGPINDKNKHGAALCFVKPYSDLMRPLRTEQPECMVCTGRCAYICRTCAEIPTSFLNLVPASYCTLKHAKQDVFHQLICKELNKTKTSPTIKLPTNKSEYELIEKQHRLLKDRLHLHIKNTAISIQSEGNLGDAIIAAKTLAKYTYHLLGTEHPEYVQAEYMLAQCYLDNEEPVLASHSLMKIDSIFHFRGDDDRPSLDEQARFFEFSGEIKLAQYTNQSVKDESFLDDALSNFSENIVCQTATRGTESWQMAYGLWRLGSVFQAKGDTLIATSMFRQSVAIWIPFLSDVIFNKPQAKLQSESMRVLLGKKKSVRRMMSPEVIKAALANISALYKLWFETCEPGDDDDIMLVSYAYAMISYTTDDLMGCRTFSFQAREGVNRMLGAPKHIMQGIHNLFTLVKRRLSISTEPSSFTATGQLASNFRVGRVSKNSGNNGHGARRRSSLSNTQLKHGSSINAFTPRDIK